MNPGQAYREIMVEVRNHVEHGNDARMSKAVLRILNSLYLAGQATARERHMPALRREISELESEIRAVRADRDAVIRSRSELDALRRRSIL